jgi:ATPase subunit of ABC transporter with duplicated ATPase domains
MITVKHLSFGYATRQILDDISFTINDNAKVALVGPNGAGKSTLFEILSGVQEYDTGTIDITGTIGVVPQEVSYDPDLEAAASIKTYLDPGHTKRDDELERMLAGMELSKLSLGAIPSDLSGGQKTKLAFIRNLIAEPDILLLDEPTNFLDIPGKHWVMQFLAKYPKTLLVISHDIALLDQSITKTLAINTHTHKVEEYTGNYSQFKRLQKEREDHLRRQRAAQEKQITQMKKGLAKIQGAQSEKGVRQKINLQNRIAKAQANLPELPPQLKGMRFKLPDPSNVGRIALQIKNVSKSFDQPVITNLSFLVERGQKVALIGRNGAGKTTLLKMLLGELQPDAGTIERHELLDIGYYAQERESFDLSQSLIEAVIAQVPEFTDGQARALLGRFMFSGDRAYQSIGSLSGGEKTRLAIALLTVKGHNLLILDEPTTYLDVMSQRVILEVLKDYQGAMIVVSHTEDFVKELEPDRGLILPDNLFDFWRPEMLDKVGLL